MKALPKMSSQIQRITTVYLKRKWIFVGLQLDLYKNLISGLKCCESASIGTSDFKFKSEKNSGCGLIKNKSGLTKHLQPVPITVPGQCLQSAPAATSATLLLY